MQTTTEAPSMVAMIIGLTMLGTMAFVLLTGFLWKLNDQPDMPSPPNKVYVRDAIISFIVVAAFATYFGVLSWHDAMEAYNRAIGK